MGIRDKIRRLERQAAAEMVEIQQVDGSVKVFPEYELREAYSNFFDRLGAGDDAPPEHPLIEAARNSSDPGWRGSYFAVEDPDDWTEPIPDLSEP